ncbi:MAG: response regulator [Bacteroidales bacterium]|nr:response regulator [Bacteroidales bacterium]
MEEKKKREAKSNPFSKSKDGIFEPAYKPGADDDLIGRSFNVLPLPTILTNKDFIPVRINNAASTLINLYSEPIAEFSILDFFRFDSVPDKAALTRLIGSPFDAIRLSASEMLTGRIFSVNIVEVVNFSEIYYLFQFTEQNSKVPPLNSSDVDSITAIEDNTILPIVSNGKSSFVFDNSFLKTIIESLPHPFYVIEASSNKALVRNDAAIRFEESLDAVHCYMSEKPDLCVGNAYSCALRMVITSATPVRIEHEFVLKTGEKRIFEVFGYPVQNHQGSLKYVIQYSIDITDRKRNEIELLEYQSILDNLMNNLPGMAFRCLNESNWTMEYVSPGCKKLTGYSANELINNNMLRYGDIIHKDDRKRVWEDVQNAVKRHRVYRLEYRIIARNGRIKHVLEQGKGVFDKYDKLVRLEGLVTDITEGKQAEILLKNELAINQGIATIGVELLNDSIKPARVAYLVQRYSRQFTGSQFSLLISPASDDEKSYMYCYDENSEKEISRKVKKHDPKLGQLDGLVERLLKEMKPVIINEQGVDLKIPCISPGQFSFNRLLSVPAFINNQYAGIIILADSEQDYTEDMVAVVQRFINMFALAAYRLKAEESLQLAKEKAEESDRLKSLFLSNMSHEIRTPMNAILGFAEMLQDAELSIDEKDRFLDVIIKSGDNLLRLINDIIDISKIEAGQLKIIYSDCYLNEMFIDLEIFFNREMVRLHKDHLTLYMQPGNTDPDFAVYTDPVRLRQVITNLTGNAFKFTDEGFIEIGYRIKDEKIEFYVRDSGIGIPVDQQKLIFERFGQVREAASHNLSGTGLGLTISKNLVEMLGGSMRLDSYPGEGSTFWFDIPLKVGRHRSEINAEPDSMLLPRLDLSGKCILVVEDVDTNYFYISSLLEKLNCRVIRAGDGQKAVDHCKENPEINLVLMDIELPVMDGYKATQIIKELRPELPVIAQTAFAMMGERERCLEAGCDDYIAKPIRKELLFELISRFI